MTTSQRRIGEITRSEFQSDLFSSPCLEVVVDGKKLRYVLSNPHSAARVETLFEKEPTTIPWLESIKPGQTLVDIGANVGMYSIYAAVMTGCRIFAFEPESLNYAELNKNIFANHLHERIVAICMALSDEEKVDYLNLGCFGASYSHHDFGENTWLEDKWFGDRFTSKDARLRQGSVSSTLDRLVERGVVPVPDHVKIDVDGIEHRVFAGARRTFSNPSVQTVLMEINFFDDRNQAVIQAMTDMGWKFSWAQLRTNRKKILTTEYIEKIKRQHRGGFNYIFFRDNRYEELFEDFLSGFEPPWAHKVSKPAEAPQ